MFRSVVIPKVIPCPHCRGKTAPGALSGALSHEARDDSLHVFLTEVTY
jgi:hypothetical protein